MKTNTRKESERLFAALKEELEADSPLPKRELFERMSARFPDLKLSSLTWRLHDLVTRGEIQNVGRGLYAKQGKPTYKPSISPPLRKLSRKVKAELPFLDFCVWDSAWLNEFMVHQLFHTFLVLEVERTAIRAAMNCITKNDQGRQFALKPDEDLTGGVLKFGQEIVFVHPLVSEAPLQRIDTIAVPQLEKLLVDMLSKDEIFIAQQDELTYIFRTAFKKYGLNTTQMRRYARRRNVLPKLEIFAAEFLNPSL